MPHTASPSTEEVLRIASSVVQSLHVLLQDFGLIMQGDASVTPAQLEEAVALAILARECREAIDKHDDMSMFEPVIERATNLRDSLAPLDK